METIRTIAWMKEKAKEARLEQRVIGFVPTMGRCTQGTWRWWKGQRKSVRRCTHPYFESETVWAERGFVQVPAAN